MNNQDHPELTDINELAFKNAASCLTKIYQRSVALLQSQSSSDAELYLDFKNAANAIAMLEREREKSFAAGFREGQREHKRGREEKEEEGSKGEERDMCGRKRVRHHDLVK
jgi:hypothetical protein